MPNPIDFPYESRSPFEAQRIGAAAVYCSDGRYGEAMDEFLHEGLALPHYDRLALPGGPACLGGHLTASRDEQALELQLRFLIDTHDLRHVVLIAHEGCGFYLKRLGVSSAEAEVRQRHDLAHAAARIRSMSSHVAVDAIFARPFNGRIYFERVEM